MTLISAHRCGARELGLADNSYQALRRAADSGFDFIEIDVQCTSDRQFVLSHDRRLADSGLDIASASWAQLQNVDKTLVNYQQALNIIAASNSKAHLDFKFAQQQTKDRQTSIEVQAAQQAIEALGPDRAIITSTDPGSVTGLRQWSADKYPQLMIGLSLGSTTAEMSPLSKLNQRRRELFPAEQFSACQANLLVAERRLARWRLARWSRRQRLPLLVWTVDQPEELRYWLNGPQRPWLLTTNYPRLARQLLFTTGK